jgi:hypothetical protein
MVLKDTLMVLKDPLMMLKDTLMVLKDTLIGIWILALWSAAHIVPAGMLAADTAGTKGILLWLIVVGELALAAGLVLGWRVVRYLTMGQVFAHVLICSLVGWVFVFVGFAWGLHGNEVPILATIAVYVMFTGWAFVYLFHPGVEDHFAKVLNPRV